MRRFPPLLLLAVLLLAACGSSHAGTHSTPVATTAPPAPPPNTAEWKPSKASPVVCKVGPLGPYMGECIAQALKAEGKLTTSAPVKTAHNRHCEDLAIYQGNYPDLSGVACVILQSNFGLLVENSIYSQMRDAREHHVLFGCYSFLEPGISGESEAALANRICPVKAGRSLGLTGDSEITGAYPHSCAYAREAARLSHIVMTFSYPGGYAGGHCVGWLYASEWGVPGPYSFGGFPATAIKLWQNCGTCYAHGVQTDQDVDEGVIALAHQAPPYVPPTLEHLQHELAVHSALEGHYAAQIVHLRHKLARYGCYPGLKAHRAGPRCRGWKAAGNRVNEKRTVEARLVAKVKREIARHEYR
jgi:hypothetical protein